MLQSLTKRFEPLYFGWSVGTVGVSLLLNTQNVAALFFFVTVLKIEPLLAGSLITLSKVYDLVTDPIMGTISDRTRSRWGRRRPYLVSGGLACGITFAMLFSVPDFESQTAVVVYVTSALLLLATAYTIFNVPYLAMPAEMVEGYNDRSVMMSYRVFFIAVATFAATSGWPVLISFLQDVVELSQRDTYRYAGIIFGVLIALGMTGAFFGTRNATFTEQVKSTLPFTKRMRLLVENRPFLLFMGIKLTGLFAFASLLAAKFSFISVVMQRPLAIAFIFGVTSLIGQLLALPVAVQLAKRYGKVRIIAISAVMMIVFTLTWLLSGPNEPLWVYGTRGFFLGIAGIGTILGAQAIMPDVMEYDYRRTGLRREGVYAGVASFIEKTAFTLSALVIGGFLSYMGFDRNLAPEDQSQTAIWGVMICQTFLPISMYALKLVFLYFYDLDEEKLKSTRPVAQAT